MEHRGRWTAHSAEPLGPWPQKEAGFRAFHHLPWPWESGWITATCLLWQQGIKKGTLAHKAALKAKWAMPSWKRILCDYCVFFSYLLTNIYREGSKVWWLTLPTGIFPRLHALPAPLSVSRGGLVTSPGCVLGVSDRYQKMKRKPVNSCGTEVDIAAFIADLLENHLIPRRVARKSTQKSQYWKWRECSSGDIQATATLKAILPTSQPWQSTNMQRNVKRSTTPSWSWC